MSDCTAVAPATNVWRNHNVLLTLIVRASDGLSAGIWNGATLAAYIYLVQNHSNRYVGIAEGIFGIFCAAAGVPAGWVADRVRRDRTLRICGFVMLAAVAATVTALFLPPHQLTWQGHLLDIRYVVLLGAMVLWGIAEGYSPVVDAIFADSVPTGGRAGIYTLAFSVFVVASSGGQFVAAALFLSSGNQWNVSKLALVILVGMIIALVPAVTLGMFDDNKTLGEESEAFMAVDMNGAEADAEGGSPGRPRKPPNAWTSINSINFMLPAILLASDAVFGMAAGMTVKFFPIFFKEKVGLSPATTNVVMACIPLVLAPLSFVAQRIGNVIGRVPTIMTFEAIGVMLMAIVGMFPAVWPQATLVVPMIILRSAANNCCYALEKSLLMDYVRKDSRGRWNSLDCLLAFGWCGSAVAGGFLLDTYGFDLTFIITASAQGFAVLMLIPLVFILRGDAAKARAHGMATQAAADAAAPDQLQEPLLNGMAECISEAAAFTAEENVVAPPVGLIVGTRLSLERERMLAQAANGYDTPLATTPK